MNLKLSFALLALSAAARVSAAESTDDPLAPWRHDVKISPVSTVEGRHTMHAYFNTCPESPDGRYVLFFASKSRDGHQGEVCIRDRQSGEEKSVATNITAEDAHRVACQQWVSGGNRVVFHGQRDGDWFVGCVDLDTMKERVIARNQLAGWGQPNADVVPLYSPHWHPGDHRDLDIINVVTGEKKTVCTVDALKEAYPDWFTKTFGEKKPSIFFPILSPDLQRVFFKMALATGEDPRSAAASARQGLICYSIAEKRFLYMNPNWGHPSWQPDSRHITEVHFVVYDSDNGKVAANPGFPTKQARAAAEGGDASALAKYPVHDVSGDHPSVSPDGKIVVTDTIMSKFGGKPTDWGIVLTDPKGTGQIIIHTFDNSHGAESWRRSHPHPVFSPDGKRIYFNVSDGEFTRLYVAEIK